MQIELDVDFRTEVAPFLGRLIGSGGFGRVYEGIWRGQRVAVKTVLCETDQQTTVGLLVSLYISNCKTSSYGSFRLIGILHVRYYAC